MAGWHHWLNGRDSQWTPGVGDGQGGLACCNSWGRKESDTTEQLKWTELMMSREKDIKRLFISIIHGLKPGKSVRRYIHGICSFCLLRLLCVNIIFNLQSYFYSLQPFDEVNIITSRLQIKTEGCQRLHILPEVISRSRGGAWTQFRQNSKPAHSPSIT